MTKRRPSIKGREVEILRGQPPPPPEEPAPALPPGESQAGSLGSRSLWAGPAGSQARSLAPEQLTVPEPERKPPAPQLDAQPQKPDPSHPLPAREEEPPEAWSLAQYRHDSPAAIEQPPEAEPSGQHPPEEAPVALPFPPPDEDEWENNVYELPPEVSPFPGAQEDWLEWESPQPVPGFVFRGGPVDEWPTAGTGNGATTRATPTALAVDRLMGIDPALYQPPPAPDLGDGAGSVLPPRPRRSRASTGPAAPTAPRDESALELQLGTADLVPDLTYEEKNELLGRLQGDRLVQLERGIDDTCEQVRQIMGNNDALAAEAYDLLMKARDIVLRRESNRVAQAEYLVEVVQARLKRVMDSQRATHKYAWRIVLWGGLWGTALVALLLVVSYEPLRALLVPARTASLPVDLRIFLPSMLWGGIGGVAAVWYGLLKHVSRRDFDPAYNLSYVGKPALGLILGGVVYLLFHLVVLMVGILPGSLQGTGQIQVPVLAPWFIYLLAFAFGFKENRIFELIDRAAHRLVSQPVTMPEEPKKTG